MRTWGRASATEAFLGRNPYCWIGSRAGVSDDERSLLISGRGYLADLRFRRKVAGILLDCQQ